MKLAVAIFLFAIIVNCSNPTTMDKQYFEVRKVEITPKISNLLISLDSTFITNEALYKILPQSSESDYDKLNYPPRVLDVDKQSAIRLLLAFKGDTRICVLPIISHDPFSSTLYYDEQSKYSIQTEALFLINQIVFDAPFKYSPIPVLVDIQDGMTESIEGEIIDRAFESYKKWVDQLQKLGLQEIKKRGIKPLDGSGIRWY